MIVFFIHSQMNKAFNNAGRNQLEQFVGQQISFAGLIVDTKCPQPGQRFICLKKLDIARSGTHIHCHHMWLDISHLQEVKVRLCQWIQGNAYVEEYQRRNGSSSYGITEASGMTAVAA